MRSYEIILTGFEGFDRDLLPKLVYHLESIGAHLPDCRGVVISAFAGERLYFIEAQKFLSRLGVEVGGSGGDGAGGGGDAADADGDGQGDAPRALRLLRDPRHRADPRPGLQA